MIYKLLRPGEWAALERDGRFAGSPADVADGFIHFSTAEQARGTAEKHFAGEAEVVLAEVDEGKLPSELKWEPSRGGKLFPHLYGALPRSAVGRTWTLYKGTDGRHVFPEGSYFGLPR